MVYKPHHNRPRTKECVCCGGTLTRKQTGSPMCEECYENGKDIG